MKCLFCPAIEIGDKSKLSLYCSTCETSFFYNTIDDMDCTWQFFLKYKEYQYCVTYEAHINKTIIRGYSLKQGGYFKTLAILNGMGHITPHNILQKLPFIITFS
jgi:hypothetical protein